MDDLIGVHEIKEEHGIDRMQVRRLLLAGDWPEPVANIAAGRVWRRADVEAAVGRLRTEGRINSVGMLIPRRYLEVAP